MPKIKPRLKRLKGHTGALGGAIIVLVAIIQMPEFKAILPVEYFPALVFIVAILGLLSKSIQR